METIKRVDIKADGTTSEIFGEYDRSNYEVLQCYWVRSDNIIVREWTPDEYIKCDPYSMISIEDDVNGFRVTVVAHCVEHRSYIATKSKGIKVMTFETFEDYRELKKK